MIYGISETTRCPRRWPRWVNYYLDYRTSETLERALMPSQMVNYYLDYRTPETNKALSAGQHG
mgnify:CR=1 FL=1